MMLGYTILLLIFPLTLAETQCSIPGQCIDGELITLESLESEKACLSECRDTEDCAWYTFDNKLNICELFKTCPDVSQDQCPDCLSGESDCSFYQCGLTGSCQVYVYFFAITTLIIMGLMMTLGNPT